MTVDYFDSVYFRTQQKQDCGPRYIAELTRDLAQHGVSTIVVRLSAGGLFEYDSPLSYPIQNFDPSHVDRMRTMFSKVDGLPDNAVEGFKRKRVFAHNQFRLLLDEFDPRFEFVKHGHKAGLKVLFWIDLFDDGYPGYRSKFIEQNPECVWTSQSGFRHPAVISYAFEKSRQFRVDQTRELLSSGADGIYLSMSAHSRHFYLKDDPGEFGFEAPVAEVYKKFSGRDLVDGHPINRRLWNHIKGEFMDRLYERIAEECHSGPRRRECWIGLQLGSNTNLTTEGAYTGPVRISFENHWQSLAAKGIADTFVLADYEYVNLFAHPKATRYWKNKQIPAATEREALAWAGKTYVPALKKTRLVLWADVSAAKLKTESVKLPEIVRAEKFDGIFLHESRDFEVGGMKWLEQFKAGFTK